MRGFKLSDKKPIIGTWQTLYNPNISELLCDMGFSFITVDLEHSSVSIVTISGKSPDNKSRKLGDLNFYVPLDTYGLVESAHAALLHCWLDLYMEKYKGGRH